MAESMLGRDKCIPVTSEFGINVAYAFIIFFDVTLKWSLENAKLNYCGKEEEKDCLGVRLGLRLLLFS